MVEGVSSCMPVALRSVGDAIRLDSEKKIKEAYCQYLSCIVYISQVLKDDAWDKDLRSVYNSDTAKLFQLLHQCQERALMIISSHASSPPAYENSQAQTAKNLSPPTEGPHRRHSDSSLPSQQHLTPQTGTHHNISNPAFPKATLMTPPTDATLHLPSPPGSPRMGSNRKHFGSPTPIRKRSGNSDPLEKAYKENQQLIMAYRIRIQNHVSGSGDMTSRNLSLLRRMSENLVIAKAREEALKKKLVERQQRLQEEANRRFGPAILSTKEEQEKRLVYTKILEFEQETVWPKHLRERLKGNPGDSKLIKEIITKIFCSADHPLTQFLLDCQYHLYRKLAPLVKDVGICSGKRADKAEGSSGENKALLEELGSNQRVATTKSVEIENGEENTLISVRGAESSVEQSSSELKSEEVSDGQDEDGSKSVSSDFSENSRLESQEELNDRKQGNEGRKISSNTDLEKLKSLLEDNSQTDSTENNNALNTDLGDHPDSKKDEKFNSSSEFENYFRELEEDMLEWESSDDNNDDDDDDKDSMKSTQERVRDRAGKTVEERTPGDVKVEQSENGMGNPLPSFYTDKNDQVTQRGDGEHSVQLSDSAVANGKVDSDQLLESKVQDSVQEPKHSDRRDFQPTDVLYPGNTTVPCCIMGPCDDGKSESVSEDPGNENREPAGGDGNEYEANSGLERKPAERDNTETMQNPVSPVAANEDENERVGVTAAATEEVRSQLKNVFLDIRFFLEKLQNFLMLAYEQLDTPAGRDLCHSCVEYPFFKPLWPVLLSVLRQVNYDKEVCLADVMTENINKKPEDFGVPQRLCLNDQEALTSTGNSYPYQLAVEELHRVVTFFCPLEKLECIVRTSRCICQCVEDYWEIKGKPRHSSETAIGCDDLLPILSYVIIRSGMAQLISECDAMEEFTPEGYLMGEEGYCLTTLLTALAYLATLKT